MPGGAAGEQGKLGGVGAPRERRAGFIIDVEHSDEHTDGDDVTASSHSMLAPSLVSRSASFGERSKRFSSSPPVSRASSESAAAPGGILASVPTLSAWLTAGQAGRR